MGFDMLTAMGAGVFAEAASVPMSVPVVIVIVGRAVAGERAESVRVPTAVPAVSAAPFVSAVPARQRGVLVPAERSRDRRQARDGRRVVLGAHSPGDRGADAVDDGSEPLLGGASVVGQLPRVLGGGDPAELDQATELAVVDRSSGGDAAVDGVEKPPVAACDALVLEGTGELCGEEPIGRGEPVAERAFFR